MEVAGSEQCADTVGSEWVCPPTLKGSRVAWAEGEVAVPGVSWGRCTLVDAETH